MKLLHQANTAMRGIGRSLIKQALRAGRHISHPAAIHFTADAAPVALPESGPLVIVGSVPTHWAQAVAVLRWALKHRDDVRIWAGDLPWSREIAWYRQGLKSDSDATAWLSQGKCLIVFGWLPVVEKSVGHFITESMASAALLYFESNERKDVHVGPIYVPTISDPLKLTRYLSLRSGLYMRAKRGGAPRRLARLKPLIEATEASRLQSEVETLRRDHGGPLATNGAGHEFYIAGAHEISGVLREITRLREMTYRSEGEGSGEPQDTDSCDPLYQHLFLWDPARRQIIGASRIRVIDQGAIAEGARGIYSLSLFDFGRVLTSLGESGKVFDMGRTFVVEAYQRDTSQPLKLMWRGIAEFLSRNPDVRYGFGVVSMSGTFSPVSVQLLRRFYRADVRDAVAAVKPSPMPGVLSDDELEDLFHGIRDSNDLNEHLALTEPMGRTAPPLFDYYASLLGGKFLGFTYDAEFNSYDSLVLVDFAKTDPKILRFFMGREKALAYRKHHALTPS